MLHVNVIKIQILVGTVVKVQLSYWNVYCYIVCQIKEGMLVMIQAASTLIQRSRVG